MKFELTPIPPSEPNIISSNAGCRSGVGERQPEVGKVSAGRSAAGSKKRSARAAHRITALGEMTFGIAHDFRNVLAIIESGLSLAERSLDNSAESRAYLAAAHDGVERGLRLTSQLLAFAKPQKPDIHPEDANDLIRKLALFLKYGAGPGVRIRFDLADVIPLCPIEPSQFNAAILNLVVNARDAMPDGGEITIATKPCQLKATAGGTARRDTYLLIRVTDAGQGMSPETVERIFDPYFTTKGNTGAGLGVPQVRAFMELIGGRVRVTSKPGIGTTFDLLFPTSESASQAPDNLWLQLDRWVNEGGSPEQARSRSVRKNSAIERRPRQAKRDLQ